MKITTRAVYDMTDPRFWGEDFEQAKVSEESFEYEGEVALCSMHDGPGTDRGDGGLGGMSGGNDSGSSYNDSRDNISSSVDSSWGGTQAAGHSIGQSEGTFNSSGNRVSAPSAYGGSWTTAYGVADYAKANNMNLARASQAVSTMDANNRYSSRRAQEKADYATAKAGVVDNINNYIGSTGLSPSSMAALDLQEAPMEGRIGDMMSIGVMSEPQANAFAAENGDFGYQVGKGIERGTGLDLNMSIPEDVQTKEESYTSAISDGQINADGSLTAKGYFNAYGPLLGIAAAPIAGAVFNATASLPQTLAAWGASKLAGTVAASPISKDGRGAALGGVTDVVASQLGVPEAMTGLSPALVGSWAGNMIDLADARNSANPDAGVTTGGYDVTGGEGGGSQSLAGSYLSANMVAQNETTDTVNHAAEYKARQGSSSGGLTGGYDYSGLNMFS